MCTRKTSLFYGVLIAVAGMAVGLVIASRLDLAPASSAQTVNVPSINSAPLTLKSLRGKVVVIDFWAFDCEPCIEAMPHIQQLNQKYGPEGLLVIGVHTPRAEYEKDVTKLRDAITKMRIKFPVVVDNQQKIFRDYLCDLWPSQFVVDGNGLVRYSHGGVGRYDDMEQVVEQLLNVQRSQ